jgi:hypothetical protein
MEVPRHRGRVSAEARRAARRVPRRDLGHEQGGAGDRISDGAGRESQPNLSGNYHRTFQYYAPYWYGEHPDTEKVDVFSVSMRFSEVVQFFRPNYLHRRPCSKFAGAFEPSSQAA